MSRRCVLRHSHIGCVQGPIIVPQCQDVIAGAEFEVCTLRLDGLVDSIDARLTSVPPAASRKGSRDVADRHCGATSHPTFFTRYLHPTVATLMQYLNYDVQVHAYFSNIGEYEFQEDMEPRAFLQFCSDAR